MIFITLLILCSLILSSCAAYFSIYGLASIFTSSFWSIVIMGSSLEMGKLMAASYLYRYWYKINFMMKSYLMSAILVLMMITSMGIFGYLSASYQEDSIPLKEVNDTIIYLKSEKLTLVERKKQIDNDISSLPNNYVSGRKKMMASYKPELFKIANSLEIINLEIKSLNKSKVSQESHTGTIIYIAKVFGKEVDDAIKYMILMIIFAFDPLAIMLVLSANLAINDRKNTKNSDTKVTNTQTETISSPIDEDIVSVLNVIKSKKEIIKSVRIG